MKVKICGITHPIDAENAARSGADYIGVIFCERSKRKVPISLATEIADTAKQMGAEPVGVFAEQNLDQILAICDQTSIRTLQLHGEIAKQAMQTLIGHYSLIYAFSVERNGSISDSQMIPDAVIALYDHSHGGMGTSFDWKTFRRPKQCNWILAGGLNPDNVAEAICLLKPQGVDVSSGVEFQGKVRKDPHLVQAFIQAAKRGEP